MREGIRSTISIPLFHDRMLGVFNFDSEAPSQYSEKDLEILLPVAKQIAIALENALLFEEISKEKKEWERTFDAITDMVWIEDGRQQVIRANQTLLMRTGFSRAELIDKHCGELLGTHRHPAHRRLPLLGYADREAAVLPGAQELRAAASSTSGPIRSSMKRAGSTPSFII